MVPTVWNMLCPRQGCARQAMVGKSGVAPDRVDFWCVAGCCGPSGVAGRWDEVASPSWNAVVGATVTGVVAVKLYNLYQRHRHYGGISAQAYTTEVLPLAKAHVIVGPVVMTQTRWGLLDLFCGGLRSINAYHPAALSCEPFPGESTTIAS